MERCYFVRQFFFFFSVVMIKIGSEIFLVAALSLDYRYAIP